MFRFHGIVSALILAALSTVAVSGETERLATEELRLKAFTESARIHGVTEPITVCKCIYWEDGGSVGVEFVDARRKLFRICLDARLPELDDSEPAPLLRPESPFHLHVGVLHPDDGGRVVPQYGREEFLWYGLFLRWFDRHPDAAGIAARNGSVAHAIDPVAAKIYHLLIHRLDRRLMSSMRIRSAKERDQP